MNRAHLIWKAFENSLKNWNPLALKLCMLQKLEIFGAWFENALNLKMKLHAENDSRLKKNDAQASDLKMNYRVLENAWQGIDLDVRGLIFMFYWITGICLQALKFWRWLQIWKDYRENDLHIGMKRITDLFWTWFLDF